ncbi:hypothetical protein GCM10023146_18940 [Nocardioides caricicola]
MPEHWCWWDADSRRAPAFERLTLGLRATDVSIRRKTMGKTGRKRRARKKKGANHGKRPNA